MAVRMWLILLIAVFFVFGGCGKEGSSQEGGTKQGVAVKDGKAAKKKKKKKKKKKGKKAAKKKDSPNKDEVKTAKVEKKTGAVEPKTSGPLTERREETVYYVAFRGQPGTPSADGVANPMTIRVEPNTSGKASVGVMGEFAKALGSQWTTATWLAAINASQALGMPLTAHEFVVKASGHIDGPSAGMMMTATMMAIMNRAKIREDSTMTGTVNPDGSAGPVDGIPQKMQGAKAKKRTRFGYPLGSRDSTDLRTQQRVDLKELAGSMEMEVHEIRDLWQAYEFLTDQKLPRPEPVNESDMELDRDMRTLVNAKVMGWKSRLSGDMTLLKQEVQQLGKLGLQMVSPLLQGVDKWWASAQRYEASSQVVAAYVDYMRTAASLRMARNTFKFIKAVLAADFNQMNTMVKVTGTVRGRIDALATELKVAGRKKTVGGAINAVNAFQTYVLAEAYFGVGRNHYQTALKKLALLQQGNNQVPGGLQGALADLLKPVNFFAAAEVLVEFARESMTFGTEEGQQKIKDAKVLGDHARTYASAAAAGLSYFDALVTEQMANQRGMSTAAAQAVMSNVEFGYLLAREATNYAEYVRDKPEMAIPRLAAGSYAYMTAGSLVNKYYSLRATLDQQGKLVLGNRKALTHQLDMARRTAREAAGQCKTKLGFIPAAAKYQYQLAAAMREGDDDSKLESLMSFWESTFYSRLAVALAP